MPSIVEKEVLMDDCIFPSQACADLQPIDLKMEVLIK
jgi:hypothetical protein